MDLSQGIFVRDVIKVTEIKREAVGCRLREPVWLSGKALGR